VRANINKEETKDDNIDEFLRSFQSTDMNQYQRDIKFSKEQEVVETEDVEKKKSR